MQFCFMFIFRTVMVIRMLLLLLAAGAGFFRQKSNHSYTFGGAPTGWRYRHLIDGCFEPPIFHFHLL